MKEIRPKGTGIQNIIDSRSEEKIELHSSLKENLERVLSAFKYTDTEIENVIPYVLDSNPEIALSTAIPMYAFFGLYENNARVKEEFYDDYKKTLELSSIKDSKQTASAQKGGVRTTDIFKKTVMLKLQWKKIRLDCEVLKEAMKLRVQAAQTMSANTRTQDRGPWNHI
jgi:hypothetical protein